MIGVILPSLGLVLAMSSPEAANAGLGVPGRVRSFSRIISLTPLSSDSLSLLEYCILFLPRDLFRFLPLGIVILSNGRNTHLCETASSHIN
ncbi:hypothetical protein KC19_10G123000 [Ceratodon purpureus]|uniref:Secreted protein n=1 Tax=Ceratodon purpureus TaxID=3225 RepID=A0A8T0GJL4_CERPU|nr:hypothetical protein KC19_10G123000 [Ceratodon purpureus]